jgi:hypothetical protein
MLALANVLDLFAHEFAGLSRRRPAQAFGVAGSLECGFVRHVSFGGKFQAVPPGPCAAVSRRVSH